MANTRPPITPVVEANNRFAFRIYALLRQSAPDSNLFFSPFSIESALLMTLEGARGTTAWEMESALSLTPESPMDRPALPLDLTPFRKAMRDYLDPRKKGELKKQMERDRSKLAGIRSELQKKNQQTIEELKAGRSDLANQTRVAAHELANRMNALAKTVDTVQHFIANSIWVDKALTVRDAFHSWIENVYGTAAFMPADFQHEPEKERKAINDWVCQQTESKIQQLLNEGLIREDTRIVLVNAIYFRGNWSIPFDSSMTKTVSFEGGQSRVRMMSNQAYLAGRYGAFNSDFSPYSTPDYLSPSTGNSAGYPTIHGFQVVDLPYNGDAFQMTVLLPTDRDGLNRMANSLNYDSWLKLETNMRSRTIDLELPTFKMESSFDLKKVMQGLGMRTAFSDDADFSGMIIDTRLMISAIIHKAIIEVNEQGSEAAAATAVLMVPTGAAMVSQKPFVPKVHANRPFLFMIRERRTGLIMFMGQFTIGN